MALKSRLPVASWNILTAAVLQVWVLVTLKQQRNMFNDISNTARLNVIQKRYTESGDIILDLSEISTTHHSAHENHVKISIETAHERRKSFSFEKASVHSEIQFEMSCSPFNQF